MCKLVEVEDGGTDAEVVEAAPSLSVVSVLRNEARWLWHGFGLCELIRTSGAIAKVSWQCPSVFMQLLQRSVRLIGFRLSVNLFNPLAVFRSI